MKKTWHIIAGLLFLTASVAQAQFTYTTNADDITVTITGYTGSGGAVVIPATINGLPVTGIGEDAFEDCVPLICVTIPDSVTNIGDAAFQFCGNLANVTFGDCVTSIGRYAFENCNDLTGIIIPNSVISIGDEAFYACTDLTNATIPNSVASIGELAFGFCVSLTSVTIPNNVTNIGDEAFGACESLTAITVDAQNLFYSSTNGVLFDKDKTTLIEYPSGLGGSYTIPDSVTNIGDEAFLSCGKLINVTIPRSVTGIGGYAFGYCDGLAGVFFTGNAPAVGSDVFFYFSLGGPPSYTTAYYLPGTTGWDSTFSGLPTVLWNPLIQTGDGNFGIQNHQFGFNIAGTTNIPVAVEVCTNLANPVWTPLQTVTLTNGSVHFSEPLQANVPGRFYRLDFP